MFDGVIGYKGDLFDSTVVQYNQELVENYNANRPFFYQCHITKPNFLNNILNNDFLEDYEICTTDTTITVKFFLQIESGSKSYSFVFSKSDYRIISQKNLFNLEGYNAEITINYQNIQFNPEVPNDYFTREKQFPPMFNFEVYDPSKYKTKIVDFQGGNVPDIELVSMQGDSVSLLDLGPKWIFIDFWYINCSPCLASSPYVKSLQNEFMNKVLFIGINPIDSKEDIKRFVEIQELDFDNYLVEAEYLLYDIGINSFPRFFLINEEGIVVMDEEGRIDFQKELEMKKKIRLLLEE